jgi:hypothetical protein
VVSVSGKVGVNQLSVSVASVGAKVSVNSGMHFDECYQNANSHRGFLAPLKWSVSISCQCQLPVSVGRSASMMVCISMRAIQNRACWPAEAVSVSCRCQGEGVADGVCISMHVIQMPAPTDASWRTEN